MGWSGAGMTCSCFYLPRVLLTATVTPVTTACFSALLFLFSLFSMPSLFGLHGIRIRCISLSLSLSLFFCLSLSLSFSFSCSLLFSFSISLFPCPSPPAAAMSPPHARHGITSGRWAACCRHRVLGHRRRLCQQQVRENPCSEKVHPDLGRSGHGVI